MMGRLHTVHEFENAYVLARQHGFSNINIDLIYGFPDQTMVSWKRTVQSTRLLNPDHISLYALKVEEHTPFGAQGMHVDDDIEATMYDWSRSYLSQQGYPQYEISNFAKPGKTCQHNLIYWRGQDYLGLGVGAVGCAGGVRWENQKNLTSYFNDIEAGKRPRLKEDVLDEQTRKFERLMLGLRLREGLVWKESDPRWASERSRLAAQGYLEEIQPNTWRVTEPYIPLTHQILLPFLP
jgi:oxygen-independent coproporphyrinogen-3 oxidase